MRHDHPWLLRAQTMMDNGLVAVELVALAATGIATTWAIAEEIGKMLFSGHVTLADLLLMFLYLEVLAMIGQYLRTGQIQVRFPLYIAIVALARYLIIDAKDIDEWRIVGIAGAVLLLTFAVLVLRFGHVRYPYKDVGEADAVAPRPRDSG